MLNGGRNRLSTIYVRDAAAAILNAAEHGGEIGGRTYTPEDGRPHTWRELLGAIETAVGHNVYALPVPRTAYQAASIVSAGYGRLTGRAVIFTPEKLGEMAQAEWVCSSEEIERDLGWKARVGLGEGARLTYNWYRQAGWL
jgi:nucleoside-diphosphate-sugar epimerase